MQTLNNEAPALAPLAGDLLPRLTPGARADIANSQVAARWETLMPVPPAHHDFAATTHTITTQIESMARPTRPFFAGDAAGQIITASVLNRATASLPRPSRIVFDEPLRLTSNFAYDFSGIEIHATAASLPFLIEGRGITACEVTNLVADLSAAPSISPPPSAIRLHDSRAVRITGCSIAGAMFGVVLRTNCREIAVTGNTFTTTSRSAIYAQGANETLDITGNTITGNSTSSNGACAIVLNSVVLRDPENMAADFWPDYHWPIPTPIRQRLQSPRRCLVRGNTIRQTTSGGIYLDGAYDCVVASNTVDNADKEGICLDNGCFLVLVEDNRFTNCGMRSRQTDTDLHFDFVTHWGRDETGASYAKLPGISLDNAMACSFIRNTVTGNAGGGIKCVRTSFLNSFADCEVANNSPCTAPHHWFFGILIDDCRPDVVTDEHDFLPSHGNTVTGCTLSDNRMGVLINDGCCANTVERCRFTGHDMDIYAPWARNTICRGNQTTGRVRLYIPVLSHIRHAAWRLVRHLSPPQRTK